MRARPKGMWGKQIYNIQAGLRVTGAWHRKMYAIDEIDIRNAIYYLLFQMLTEVL